MLLLILQILGLVILGIGVRRGLVQVAVISVVSIAVVAVLDSVAFKSRFLHFNCGVHLIIVVWSGADVGVCRIYSVEEWGRGQRRDYMIAFDYPVHGLLITVLLIVLVAGEWLRFRARCVR